MNFIPVKPPFLLKHVFSNLVWNFPVTEKILYLTFDDGPTPEISDWTLDILKSYNAKATFFCVGENVNACPDIYDRIINDGHAIGNHTYNHIKGWKSTTQEYLDNIDKAATVIDSKLFRPPYGQILPKQSSAISKLDYKIIMWNILSQDWDSSISKEKCARNVINNASKGDIVVFHDSKKASHNMKYALPLVLEHFSKNGYVFKRIPELGQ